MPLTTAQRDFIQTHLKGKNRVVKAKLEGEYKDYLRREAKTQAAIDVLGKNDPNRNALETRLQAAAAKKDAGKFAAAYDDLKSVKKDALKLANGFKSTLSPQSVTSEIAVVDAWVTDMIAEVDDRAKSIEGKFDLALNALRNTNPVSTTSSKEEAFARLKSINEKAAQARSAMQMRKSEADINATEFETRVKGFGLQTKTEDIRHKIGIIAAATPGADTALTQAMDAVLARFNTAGLSTPGTAITDRTTPRFTKADADLESLLRTLTDLSKFRTENPSFTDKNGKPMTKSEIETANKMLKERFGKIEERNAKRVAVAMERMDVDLLNEQIAWRADPERRDINRIERFDAFDMLDAMPPIPKKVDEWMAVPFVKAAADGIKAELAKVLPKGSKSDVLFDMAARSRKEWEAEIADQMGIDLDDLATDPSIAKLVTQMAETIQAEVRKAFPNKAAPDMKSVTIDGVLYEDRKFLASGGGGTVCTYTNKQTGEKIVLKEPKGYKPDEELKNDKFEEFSTEARNHREVLGGEKGTPPKNIMGMEGMVLGPNGMPLLAMPLAGGGDLDRLSESVSAAKESGLISPQAQHAMVQDSVRQMAHGIKQMQDAGVSHHDLKEANVFIMDDGTIKIADFGLANILDDHDDTVSMTQNTPGYEPAELQEKGKQGEKSDNFTLGVILSKMTDPTHGTASLEKRDFNFDLTEQQTRVPDPDNPGEDKAIEVTALDRLRNALLSDDPDERPEMTQVLLSTYLYEAETAYSKESMDELRAASNEYARNVGKRTGSIFANIQMLEGEILLLEQERSGQRVEREIDYCERMIAKGNAMLKRLNAELPELDKKLTALTTEIGDAAKRPNDGEINKAKTDQEKADLQELRKKVDDELAKNPILKRKRLAFVKLRSSREAMAKKIKNIGIDITKLEQNKKDQEAKLGQRLTPVQLRDIAQQIEAKRQEIVTLRKEIDAIHDEPAAKVFADRLKQANEAFK